MAKASDRLKVLNQTIAKLQEQLRTERAREAQRAALYSFIERHPLITATDLRAEAKAMSARTKIVVARAPSATTAAVKKATKVWENPFMKPAVGKAGKAIRKARIEAGLTGMALAEKLGCPAPMISMWERGKSISEKYADGLAALLNLPEDVLRNGHAA